MHDRSGGEDRFRRVRVPPPLLRRRLPSGRGATEQPNVTGDADAPLTARFWLAVAATGVAAGLFGDLLMWILFGLERLAWWALRHWTTGERSEVDEVVWTGRGRGVG